MISISGIKYQKELEELPDFNKKAAALLIGKKGKNLDAKISRLVKSGYIKILKKGLYVTTCFAQKADKEPYSEYLANRLRQPSYLSLEYILSKEGLIPEAVYSLTSITVKTPRKYANFIGNFSYRKVRSDLFAGYGTKDWLDKKLYLASKAKALFDYFYLNKSSLADLRINWANFYRKDFTELSRYVKLSNSPKMNAVLQEVKEYIFR